MMSITELPSVPSDPLAPPADQLRLAVAAYLARFQGSCREHTDSDLRCYLSWYAERGVDPLAAPVGTSPEKGFLHPVPTTSRAGTVDPQSSKTA